MPRGASPKREREYNELKHSYAAVGDLSAMPLRAAAGVYPPRPIARGQVIANKSAPRHAWLG